MRYGAVIVAAGRSKRIKQFRQLTKIGDLSIAERVIVNFLRAGVEDIVMVTGCNAEQLEKALKSFGIHFIRNNDCERTQMFDSAKLGLEYLRCKCDRVFFCPVDIPFFTDQTVTKEMQLMDRNPEVKFIMPNCEGKDGHPLLIAGDAVPAILAHNGEDGMRGAYGSFPERNVMRVAVNDEGAVIDADYKEDFHKLVDIHNARILHPEIKVTFASTSPFFGPGTVSLLREIDKCGNVRDACEKCGFSYSKGWTIIKNCEEKFGYDIVERQAGGQSGGMARVTDKGHDLVAAYEKLESELTEIADDRFRKLMNEYKLAQEPEE